MKYVPCSCEEWTVSMPQIETFQNYAFAHGAKYTGATICYCPWCGKQLERKPKPKPKRKIIPFRVPS